MVVVVDWCFALTGPILTFILLRVFAMGILSVIHGFCYGYTERHLRVYISDGATRGGRGIYGTTASLLVTLATLCLDSSLHN